MRRLPQCGKAMISASFHFRSQLPHQQCLPPNSVQYRDQLLKLQPLYLLLLLFAGLVPGILRQPKIAIPERIRNAREKDNAGIDATIAEREIQG